MPANEQAATNRPDMVDEALLRPGRFDYLLEVRLSRLPLHSAMSFIVVSLLVRPIILCFTRAVVAFHPMPLLLRVTVSFLFRPASYPHPHIATRCHCRTRRRAARSCESTHVPCHSTAASTWTRSRSRRSAARAPRSSNCAVRRQ